MDTKVLETQNWLNQTYGGNKYWKHLELTGQTGWPTIRGLITALQIELGISAPNGSFGPATEGAYKTLSMNSNSSNQSIKNQIQILKGAMWCKGFSPGYGLEWEYDSSTALGIREFQKAAGLTGNDITGQVDKITMRALMNMDAFQLVPGGDERIRLIQQNLNAKNFKVAGLYPCDGRYGRETNKALLYAIQIEGNVSGANGNFGPGTEKACRQNELFVGTSKTGFVKIAQYALYCNGVAAVPFSGMYDSATQMSVKLFQQFTKLPETGNVDFSTWASLLRSNGDTSRKGTACDTSTRLNATTAKLLVDNGYKVVGRYLKNVPGGIDKQLTQEEIDLAFKAGLKIYPIYQTNGGEVSYFNGNQGTSDAVEGIRAALKFGFKEGTIIYFAVDYDTQDSEISNRILPYFEHIKSVFNNKKINKRNYRVGVYGTRNVCNRVGGNGYSISSFVSDMSYGYSGNLGYVLPKDWAFDQIVTTYLGNGGGAGSISIDNNIASGRYNGEGAIENPEDLNTMEVLNMYSRAYLKKLALVFPESLIPSIEIDNLKYGESERYTIGANTIVEMEAGEKTSLGNNGDIKATVKIEKGKITTATGETSFGWLDAIPGGFGAKIKGCYEDGINSIAAEIDNGILTFTLEFDEMTGAYGMGVELYKEIETPISLHKAYLSIKIFNKSLDEKFKEELLKIKEKVSSSSMNFLGMFIMLLISVTVVVALVPEFGVMSLLSLFVPVISK